jgi:hypothetical protein
MHGSYIIINNCFEEQLMCSGDIPRNRETTSNYMAVQTTPLLDGERKLIGNKKH